MSPESREDFLTFSGVFLFILLSATLIVAQWTDIQLASRVHWSAQDFGIGCLTAIVMYVAFAWLKSLRDLAGEALGKPLAQCRIYDLVILAILVGVVEEFLFRGLIEQWIARWNPIGALIIANIIFGLLHAVSPLYALLAGVLGAVLSWLTWGVGDFNLLRPIVAHAIYDFIGFSLIAREYRQQLETE